MQEVREIEQQLHEIYEREDVMYMQRSRIDWLKANDQNTQYFQNRASHRMRKNTVMALLREDGTWCTTNEEMRHMVANFYEKLFTSEGSAKSKRLLQYIQGESIVTNGADQSTWARWSPADVLSATLVVDMRGCLQSGQGFSFRSGGTQCF